VPRRAPGRRKVDAVLKSLKETFGHRTLRPGQREVIERVLAGRDTLALMPTGAGKSLCYQLPALHLEGITVVVSPLIALMKDQADKLAEAGVDAAALNSTLRAAEEAEAVEDIERERTEIVFTTPERLATAEFQSMLADKKIDVLVVDEAHCISQWGHDFRPAFLEIGKAAKAFGDPPILALTATATPEVVEDIRKQLGRKDMAVINAGMYRPNLHYEVRQVTNEDEKRAALLDVLAGHEGSAIVYVATVKAAEAVSALLSEAGHDALAYHGRLKADDRHARQEAFMEGRTRVMVATNAFGMGIDKPDIRIVAHYQVPGSLEAYYQESGRAGRDGDDACCTLLYDHGDRRIQQFLQGTRDPERHQAAREKLERMTSYAHGARCRWKMLLEYFDEAAGFEQCGRCDNCVAPPRIEE
jgi:RecQ family ATP-dependent DNA helicase